MTRNLRQILADSQIAAVTIAVLLLWSIDGTFSALWDPTVRVSEFLFHALLITAIPTDSSKAARMTRDSMFIVSGSFMYAAAASFAGAWILSRWVYGTGPFRALNRSCKSFVGRQNA